MLSQILARDAEFPHLEIESGSFQAQAGGSALRPPNNTFSLAEHLENVLPIGMFEGEGCFGGGFRRQFQFGNRDVERGAFGQDDRPLYEIFELANISRPRPLG